MQRRGTCEEARLTETCQLAMRYDAGSYLHKAMPFHQYLLLGDEVAEVPIDPEKVNRR